MYFLYFGAYPHKDFQTLFPWKFSCSLEVQLKDLKLETELTHAISLASCIEITEHV